MQKSNNYEDGELISQYLEFHYGAEYLGVGNFPKACIDRVFGLVGEREFERVLDVGCAVGRGSFELAKRAERVDAVDFSEGFIRNAVRIGECGSISYRIKDEGELSTLKEVSLDDFGLSEVAERVCFSQGDATDLKPDFKDYDLVFAGNLIDRLDDPADFLGSIHRRMKSGGLLVLTSPYTWREEFTKKESWLGGFKVDGANQTTLQGLHQILGDHYDGFAEPVDIPFVIRETARMHQHTIAQMTLWIKK